MFSAQLAAMQPQVYMKIFKSNTEYADFTWVILYIDNCSEQYLPTGSAEGIYKDSRKEEQL